MGNGKKTAGFKIGGNLKKAFRLCTGPKFRLHWCLSLPVQCGGCCCVCYGLDWWICFEAMLQGNWCRWFGFVVWVNVWRLLVELVGLALGWVVGLGWERLLRDGES